MIDVGTDADGVPGETVGILSSYIMWNFSITDSSNRWWNS